MKDKTFAAGVSREDIADACARAALDVTELIEFVVRSQKEVGVI